MLPPIVFEMVQHCIASENLKQVQVDVFQPWIPHGATTGLSIRLE